MMAEDPWALIACHERTLIHATPLEVGRELGQGGRLRSKAKHLHDTIIEEPQGDSSDVVAKKTADKFRAGPMQHILHALAQRISNALDIHLDHDEIGALAIFAAPEKDERAASCLSSGNQRAFVMDQVEDVTHLSEQAFRQVTGKAKPDQP